MKRLEGGGAAVLVPASFYVAARIAHRRREDARRHETAARIELGIAEAEVAVLQAAGHPALAAQGQADAARGWLADARADATRAQRALDDAQHDFDRALKAAREARQDAARAAQTAAGAYDALAAWFSPPPPPPQPVEEHGDEGNAGTGLLKSLGDVRGDLWGLGKGIARHVDVFQPSVAGQAWSNDWDTAKAIVDDPVGAGKSVYHSFADPITESSKHGGLDEAITRGGVDALGAVVGGKGLTKLGKLSKIGRAGEDVGDAGKVVKRSDLDVPESPPYVRDGLPELEGRSRTPSGPGPTTSARSRPGSASGAPRPRRPSTPGPSSTTSRR